jgi:predicted metal-binding protein
VDECERFIRECEESVVLRFASAIPDPEQRRSWSRGINTKLLELERDVFLLGHHKAFMLLMGGCPMCDECVGKPEDCRHPGSARPTPEGLAIDLFSTVRSVGYPLEVLKDYSQSMNRYAILLIE